MTRHRPEARPARRHRPLGLRLRRASDLGARPPRRFVRAPDGAPARGPALAGGFVSAFFSFGGWWEAARMAGEVRDPQRTLPRAFVLGITVVTAAYILTSAVFLGLVARGRDRRPRTRSRPGSGESLFGRAGGTVLALGVVVVGPRQPGRGHAGLAPALRRPRPRRPLPRAGSPGCTPAWARRATAIALQAVLAIAARARGHVLRDRGLLRVRDRGLHRRERGRALSAAAAGVRVPHAAAPRHARASSWGSPCSCWRSCCGPAAAGAARRPRSSRSGRARLRLRLRRRGRPERRGQP